MNTVFKRSLGKSGTEVSAVGLGCWTVGGTYWKGDKPLGWEEEDDKEATLAIQRALDLGINFFDTAAVYGVGHSERVLGRALRGRRSEAVIATKFGYTFDVMNREITGTNISPDYIRQACQASLRRLETSYIDLYMLHVNSVPPEDIEFISVELDRLCEEGYIRSYGWSTDDIKYAQLFADKDNCTAFESQLNIFNDTKDMLDLCKNFDLASINRIPMAMGFLTGKLNGDSYLPDDDIHGNEPEWLKYFKNGKLGKEWLDKVGVLRDILTSDGRNLVQGVLAWMWARSKRIIPVPGFKTVKQVEGYAASMQFGPLTDMQMKEIDLLLG